MLKLALSRSSQAMGDSDMSLATRDKLRTQFYDKLKDRLHALKVLHDKPDAGVRATDDEVSKYLGKRITRGATRNIQDHGGRIVRDSKGLASVMGPATLGTVVHMHDTPAETYNMMRAVTGSTVNLTPAQQELFDSTQLHHEALEVSHGARRLKKTENGRKLLSWISEAQKDMSKAPEEAHILSLAKAVKKNPFGHFSEDVVLGHGKRLHGGEMQDMVKLPKEVRDIIGRARTRSYEGASIAAVGGKYPTAPRGKGGLTRKAYRELPTLMKSHADQVSADLLEAVKGPMEGMGERIDAVTAISRKKLVEVAKTNLARTGNSTLEPATKRGLSRYLTRLAMEYIPKVR